MRRYAKRKRIVLSIGLSAFLLILLLGVYLGAGGGPTLAQVEESEGGTGEIIIATEDSVIPLIWYLTPLGSVLGLAFAFHFYRAMKREPEGTERMIEIAAFIRSGANIFLKRQYTIVAFFLVGLCLLFCVMAYVIYPPLVNPWVPFAFLTGGFFSALTGILGMRAATFANSRTTNGCRSSLDAGLRIAMKSGAVMGLSVVGFALLNASLWFFVLKTFTSYSLHEITVTMLTFGMGASFVALFARLGGGIFTKASDVGADLVGKVEAGIPEDDPRNAAVLADNVGDNVGDVSGLGADLFESYLASVLASCALGAAAGLGIQGVLAPMVISVLGTIFSILGIYLVRAKEGASARDLLSSLGLGVNTTAILISVFSLGALIYMFHIQAGHSLWSACGIWAAMVVGLLVGIGTGKICEYYTSQDYGPTKEVSEQAVTGSATVIISGMAVGYLSTGIPIAITGIGIMLSFGLAGGFTNPALGLYGVGLGAVGMLSTLGITLTSDAYGPVADNAAGIAEMSGLEPVVRERTSLLDSIGNTTAATGKGFAIGSAALTALALLIAYLEEVKAGLMRIAEHSAEGIAEVAPNIFWTAEQAQTASIADFMQAYAVNLMNPKILVSIWVGSMIAYVFSSFIMKSVGRNATRVVEEVRRQWRETPGIMEGTTPPDYDRCVEIATKGAHREMILPAMIAIVVPVVIGLVFGVGGILGLLVGGLASAFPLALMMGNAGGTWDNAKKHIEDGFHGGKGSDAHKASVVGDTVGDPFKDVVGPCMDILMKLMSTVSIVFAGVTITYSVMLAKLIGMW